eukprot:COSAG01_NODE_53344_length_339_cov_1757.025000_2_plen_40_part_01
MVVDEPSVHTATRSLLPLSVRPVTDPRPPHAVTRLVLYAA